MKESSSSSGGIGFVGFLTIAFIVLKLTKFIDWSWWWVLSPIWISVLIWIVIFGVTALVLLGVEKRNRWKYLRNREEARKRMNR